MYSIIEWHYGEVHSTKVQTLISAINTSSLYVLALICFWSYPVSILAKEDFINHRDQSIKSNVICNFHAQDTSNIDELRPYSLNRTNLDGTGVTIGVWDAGRARETHEQIQGRVFNNDIWSSLNYHTCHIVGTIAGNGIENASAQGMAPNSTVLTWDLTHDLAEIEQNAHLIQTSNHSYAPNETFSYNRWGFDLIAHKHDLCMVAATGNQRGQLVTASPQIKDDQKNVEKLNGYFTLSTITMAKNVLAVGAVKDILEEPPIPNEITMTEFSGWGPTSDGRLKPDVVANGYRLLSMSDAGDEAYFEQSGTSMAAAVVTGAIACLTQQYREVFQGANPPSSLMRSIVIHTARDGGSSPGPDYRFGWGLLDAKAAAHFIKQHSIHSTDWFDLSSFSKSEIQYTAYSDGKQPIKVTLVWNDPPSLPLRYDQEKTDYPLINDLDLAIEGTDGMHYPWTLNPLQPTESAKQDQENHRDNVEQVFIATPLAGSYTIRIRGKIDQGESQRYAICVTGMQKSEKEPHVMLLDRLEDEYCGIVPFHAYSSVPAGIARLQIQVDGKEPSDYSLNTLTGDEIRTATADEVIKSVTIDTSHLIKGNHTLTLTVQDTNNNTINRNYMFRIWNHEQSKDLMSDGPALSTKLNFIADRIGYRFTPVRSSTYTIETHAYEDEEEADTWLYIYSLQDPPKELRQDDDSGKSTFSKVTAYFTANQTYYIQVRLTNNQEGYFSIDAKTTQQETPIVYQSLQVNAPPFQNQFQDIGDTHWYSFHTGEEGAFVIHANVDIESATNSIQYIIYDNDAFVTGSFSGSSKIPIQAMLAADHEYFVKVENPKGLINYQIQVRTLLTPDTEELTINDTDTLLRSIERSQEHWYTFTTHSFGEFIVSVTNPSDNSAMLPVFNIRDIQEPLTIIQISEDSKPIQLILNSNRTFAIQVIGQNKTDYFIRIKTNSTIPLKIIERSEEWTQIQFTSGIKEEQWFGLTVSKADYYQIETVPKNNEFEFNFYKYLHLYSSMVDTFSEIPAIDFGSFFRPRIINWCLLDRYNITFLKVTSPTGSDALSFRFVPLPWDEWPFQVERTFTAPEGFLAGKPIIVDVTITQDYPMDFSSLVYREYFPKGWKFRIITPNLITNFDGASFNYFLDMKTRKNNLRYQITPPLSAKGTYPIKIEVYYSYKRIFHDSVEQNPHGFIEIFPDTLIEDWLQYSPL